LIKSLFQLTFSSTLQLKSCQTLNPAEEAALSGNPDNVCVMS